MTTVGAAGEHCVVQSGKARVAAVAERHRGLQWRSIGVFQDAHWTEYPAGRGRDPDVEQRRTHCDSAAAETGVHRGRVSAATLTVTFTGSASMTHGCICRQTVRA